MYLTAEENGKILKIIKDNFDNACILMECLAKAWVKKEGIEKSIQQTGSKFVFGADHFEDLGNMTTGYHKIKRYLEHSPIQFARLTKKSEHE